MKNFIKIQDYLININDIIMFEKTHEDKEELNDRKDLYLVLYLNDNVLYIYCENDNEYDKYINILNLKFKEANIKLFDIFEIYFNSNYVSFITIDNEFNYAIQVNLTNKASMLNIDNVINIKADFKDTEEADEYLVELLED